MPLDSALRPEVVVAVEDARLIERDLSGAAEGAEDHPRGPLGRDDVGTCLVQPQQIETEILPVASEADQRRR